MTNNSVGISPKFRWDVRYVRAPRYAQINCILKAPCSLVAARRRRGERVHGLDGRRVPADAAARARRARRRPLVLFELSRVPWSSELSRKRARSARRRRDVATCDVAAAWPRHCCRGRVVAAPSQRRRPSLWDDGSRRPSSRAGGDVPQTTGTLRSASVRAAAGIGSGGALGGAADRDVRAVERCGVCNGLGGVCRAQTAVAARSALRIIASRRSRCARWSRRRDARFLRASLV